MDAYVIYLPNGYQEVTSSDQRRACVPADIRVVVSTAQVISVEVKAVNALGESYWHALDGSWDPHVREALRIVFRKLVREPVGIESVHEGP